MQTVTKILAMVLDDKEIEETWLFSQAHRLIIIFLPDIRKNVIFIAFSDSS